MAFRGQQTEKHSFLIAHRTDWLDDVDDDMIISIVLMK